MIKVMIADDQPIVLSGLKMLLGTMPDLDVVATAPDGMALLFELKQQACDVVVMDIQMPKMNGVQATKEVKKTYPHVKILVLTTFIEDAYVFEALQNGASGYLLKDTPPEEIAHAIRTVYAGDTILTEAAAKKVFAGMKAPETESQCDPLMETLTDREIEILGLIGQGLNNKELADHLFLTEGTIKNNITKMLSKLSLRDRTQLAIFALKHDVTK